jgi:hypothetical protein
MTGFDVPVDRQIGFSWIWPVHAELQFTIKEVICDFSRVDVFTTGLLVSVICSTDLVKSMGLTENLVTTIKKT